MLTEDLSLSLTLIFALLMSNILTSIVGVTLAPWLARLTRLRIDKIALPALITSLVTIVQLNGLLADLYVAVGFGLFGYLLKRLDWPRVPFIIAFILGSFIETNLALTLRLSEVGRVSLFQQPAALIILGLILASMIWMLSGRKVAQRAAFTIKGRADAALAFGLALLALLLSATAILGFGYYSTYAQILALSTTLVCFAIAFASVTRPRRTSENTVFSDGRALPFALLAGVPIATFVFGLAAAMALLTFIWLWVGTENNLQRKSFVWGVSAIIFAGVTYVVEVTARLRLPDPFILTIFDRLIAG
jgi:putative tricarboxylic transport membrane protein